MFRKMLLATVAVVALATGAQADTVVRVGTVGPWGISLNKDKQTCNAFTQFNDTVLAIGHRENAGIWHAALFMPWANWFDDNQTVDVKVTFDFGRRQYTTVAVVEDKKDPHGKRLSFRMSGDMLIDFASSSSMQVKATVNGHDQSTPYMDLKGTRNLIEKIEDCQDTAGGTPAAASFVQDNTSPAPMPSVPAPIGARIAPSPHHDASSSGWYVMMGETQASGLRYRLCTAAIVPAAEVEAFAASDGYKRGMWFHVSKKFGPYQNEQAAKVQLQKAGWEDRGKGTGQYNEWLNRLLDNLPSDSMKTC